MRAFKDFWVWGFGMRRLVFKGLNNFEDSGWWGLGFWR